MSCFENWLVSGPSVVQYFSFLKGAAMIVAEFQLTQDDYVEAQLSHYGKLGKMIFVPGMVVLGAALVVTLAIALTDPATTSQLAPSWIFLAALFLAVILLRSGPGMLHRMQFNRLRALHEPIRFEAGEGGIVYNTGKSESTTKWEAFEKWKESKGSFLLYVQPRLYFLVPKRVLDGAQVDAFRELLKSRVH
jgi:YcxB-like protein